FTHDQFRHQRLLYDRMHELTTLITGPSGTGKELVARAIGLSGYIPFNPRTREFVAEFRGCFHPLNLSAFSKTLVESELFGHKKGAFTGATEDRKGYLADKHAADVVFLDEIGELDEEIQVKLLRVLQARQFQRLGDGKTHPFGGKIVAATNRDLAREMEEGRFRQDLFYRLCSDVIRTPSLRTILDNDPGELENLVVVLSQQLMGEADPSLVAEVLSTVEVDLGRDYHWPGNIRELEQCVRNVLVRGHYRPEYAPVNAGGSLPEEFSGLARVELGLEDVTRLYCTWAYAHAGTFEDAAGLLRCDRRTVSKYLDRPLLERLKRFELGPLRTNPPSE
ncbi:MAG: sigma 54-interacting transcriptional regulator, partial [Myxococcota bacterium]